MNAEEANLVAIVAILTLAVGGLGWGLYAGGFAMTIVVTRQGRLG